MIRRVVLAIAGALVPLHAAAAQDADFHQPADVPTITFTTALADFGAPGTYVLAGVGGVIPVGRSLAVVADVPMVFGDAGTLLGNPFVGLITGTDRRELSGRIGVRLPVASGESGLVGALADFDRAEAYVPDLMSVSAALQYRQPTSTPFLFRARLEPTVSYLVRSDFPGDRTDFFLDYGAQFGFDDRTTEAALALTGRAILSGDGADLGDRTTHQLTLSAGHAFGQLRPGIFVRLPLDDDLSEVYEHVLGVKLTLEL